MSDDDAKEEIRAAITWLRECSENVKKIKDELTDAKEIQKAAQLRFEGLVVDHVSEVKQERIPFEKATA